VRLKEREKIVSVDFCLYYFYEELWRNISRLLKNERVWERRGENLRYSSVMCLIIEWCYLSGGVLFFRRAGVPLR
jgi:fructose-1,6-bisphosphatase